MGGCVCEVIGYECECVRRGVISEGLGPRTWCYRVPCQKFHRNWVVEEVRSFGWVIRDTYGGKHYGKFLLKVR